MAKMRNTNDMSHMDTSAGVQDQQAESPALGLHGMAIIGEEILYLSHLPMWMSPHNFQVILEAQFTGPDQPQVSYVNDRRGTGTKLYTLKPAEEWDITQLVPSGPTRQAVRSSFAATIFRNHFEDHPDTHPGQRVRLADATVGVQRIIRFQRLDPRTPELPQLNYVLFGSGRELYMAHVITRPPDFDQLLSVKIIDQPLAIETLCQGILVMIPGRTNDIASKIQEGERFPGHIQNGDESSETLEIQLEAGVEFYFETQDLTSEM